MDKNIRQYLREIGSRGGKTSSSNLTKKQLTNRAKSAAKARWAKRGENRP